MGDMILGKGTCRRVVIRQLKSKEYLSKDAKLLIYPMSIEPRAELPIDMKENYHFGEI